MPNIYFTSDLHAFHKNIMKYNPSTRKGNDHLEMTQILLEGFSTLLKPGDTLYNIGDVSFGTVDQTHEFLHSIKKMGINHHLVYGNHDRRIREIPRLNELLTSTSDKKYIKHGSAYIVLNHFPEVIWDRKHYGSIHLFGHCHGSYNGLGKSMDVGIDTRKDSDMLPYHIDEIISKMELQ